MMDRRPLKTRIGMSPQELTKSGAGKHGKSGKRKNRHERREARKQLKHAQED